ncbi:hypothetical protein [Klebsiella pneumoniae]|nr:hypothetical protein [Klebsiella pneumoniae]
MSGKQKIAIPPDHFRDLVYKNEDNGRWYFKDIPENARRHKLYAIGHSLEGTSQNIKIDGMQYKAKRIIWWLETGECPRVIQKIDEDKPLDFCNLFASSEREQKVSSNGAKNIQVRKTKSGVLRYQARIKIDRKDYCVGTYSSLIEAQVATIKFRQILFPNLHDKLNKQLVKLIRNHIMGK